MTPRAGGVTVSVEANTTAPYTFFSSELPGTFSDNAITLRPGESREPPLAISDPEPGSGYTRNQRTVMVACAMETFT